jgi:hypothetical protein
MFSSSWMAPLLGVTSILAVVAVLFLVRVWPRKPELTADELADMAGTPMPPLQKRAWWGLAIGVAALATASVMIATRGAVEYWENDGFRLMVMGIFIAGLLGSALVTHLPLVGLEARGGLDERDRAVLARAPTAQATLLLLGLAAWLVALGQKFHEAGAVPMVYLYLMFGSLVLLMMIGLSVGIILGYWAGGRSAEG